MVETKLYKDFLSQGSPLNGHWNDPPKAVFKCGLPLSNKLNSTESASSEEEMSSEVCISQLNNLCDRLLVSPKLPATKLQQAKLTKSRMKLENEDIDLYKLSELIKHVESEQYIDAKNVHQNLITNSSTNIKFLVGVKWLIELYQSLEN